MAIRTRAKLLLELHIDGNHTAKQLKDELARFMKPKGGVHVMCCDVQEVEVTNVGVIHKKDPIIHESMIAVRTIIKAAFGDAIKIKQENAGGSIYVTLTIPDMSYHNHIISLTYEPSDQTLNYSTNLHDDGTEIKFADPQCVNKVYQLVRQVITDKLKENDQYLRDHQYGLEANVLKGLKAILEAKGPGVTI